VTDIGREEFRALGTGCVLVVVDGGRMDAAWAAVHSEIARIDQACSRFRDDSDLAAVNRSAGRPVRVSEVLLDAIALAQRAAELTDGDIDPTVGAAMCALGYDRDFGQIQRSAGAVITLQRVAGWRRIELDRSAGTVWVPAGASLDLGATAKAWAADRAAAAAAAAAGCGVLVSLGGDVATSGTALDDGWGVLIADDHAAPLDGPGQNIRIEGGGIATSSTTVRRWERDGRPVHHIIDPATSLPADDVWRTVSVAAATCADANIASTAAIIRGSRALDWLEELNLPARLAARDGLVRHVNGWPADGERA
jgi:thiamine biosynthesis lipoprotein